MTTVNISSIRVKEAAKCALRDLQSEYVKVNDEFLKANEKYVKLPETTVLW